MKASPGVLIAGLVAVAAGGFFIGRISSAPEEKKAGAEASKSERMRGSSRAEGGIDSGRRREGRESRESAGVGKGGPLSEKLIKMEAIMRGENPLERNRALLALIDQLGPGDFQDVVAQFRALGITQSRLGEYSLLLSAWAKADPLSALDYAKNNTNNGFASTTILASWATADPDAAIRWAKANHEGDEPNPYMIGIIRGLAETDPARATQLLTDMPFSGQRGEALAQLMPHILQQGPEAARNWVDGITDERLKNGAIPRMARSLAEVDPKGTAAWLLQNPGEALNRSLDDVYGTWAGKDQPAALASMNALPAGQEKTNALRGVVSNAASNDPASALVLMNRYPNDINDRVVQSFVWNSFDKDPSIAATTIARVGDEGQRNAMYRRFLDRWIETDLPKAEAWTKTNALPPEVAKHVEKRLETARKQ